MAKKNKYPPKPWETIDGRHFTRMYDDQMRSVAFMGLKPRQRYLYIFMKSMYKGDWTPGSTFALPWGIAQAYRLYTNKNQFYKDRDALISAGFIDCTEWNRTTRLPNIYRFSDRWKEKGLLQINTTNCSNNDTQKE